MKRKLRQLTAAAAVLCLMATLTACGSETASTDATASTGATASAPAAENGEGDDAAGTSAPAAESGNDTIEISEFLGKERLFFTVSDDTVYPDSRINDFFVTDSDRLYGYNEISWKGEERHSPLVVNGIEIYEVQDILDNGISDADIIAAIKELADVYIAELGVTDDNGNTTIMPDYESSIFLHYTDNEGNTTEWTAKTYELSAINVTVEEYAYRMDNVMNVLEEQIKYVFRCEDHRYSDQRTFDVNTIEETRRLVSVHDEDYLEFALDKYTILYTRDIDDVKDKTIVYDSTISEDDERVTIEY